MAKRQRSIRRADGNEYHEESDISSQINIAEHESWYRPKMNRVESDAYLLNTPPGAFIVRMSSKGGVVLDVQAGPRVGHVLLDTSEYDSKSYFHLPGTKHYFSSIYDLVMFCHYNTFNFQNINEADVEISLSVTMSDRAKILNEERARRREERQKLEDDRSTTLNKEKNERRASQMKLEDDAREKAELAAMAQNYKKERADESARIEAEAMFQLSKINEVRNAFELEMATRDRLEEEQAEVDRAAEEDLRQEEERLQREEAAQRVKQAALRAAKAEAEKMAAAEEKLRRDEEIAIENDRQARLKKQHQAEREKRLQLERAQEAEEAALRYEQEEARIAAEERALREQQEADAKAEEARIAAEERALREQQEANAKAEEARKQAKILFAEAQAKAALKNAEAETEQRRIAADNEAAERVRASNMEHSKRVAEENARRMKAVEGLALATARREAAEQQQREAAEIEATRRKTEMAEYEKRRAEKIAHQNLEYQKQQEPTQLQNTGQPSWGKKFIGELVADVKPVLKSTGLLADAASTPHSLSEALYTKELGLATEGTHAGNVFQNVQVNVLLIPGKGYDSVLEFAVQGSFTKPPAENVVVYTFLDIGSYMDGMDALKKPIVKGVMESGANARLFTIGAVCKEINLNSNDSISDMASQIQFDRQKEVNFRDSCLTLLNVLDKLVTTTHEAKSSNRPNASSVPQRIEVVFIMGSKGVLIKNDVYNSLRNRVAALDALNISIRVTPIVATYGPPDAACDVLAVMLAQLSSAQDEATVIVVRDRTQLSKKFEAVLKKCSESCVHLSIQLQAAQNSLCIAAFNSFVTPKKFATNFSQAVTNQETWSAWRAAMGSQQLQLVIDQKLVPKVAWTFQDYRKQILEAFYLFQKSLYCNVHRFAMAAIPVRALVQKLRAEVEVVVLLCAAARLKMSDIDGFTLLAMETRVLKMLDIIDFKMLKTPSVSRLEILELSDHENSSVATLTSEGRAIYKEMAEKEEMVRIWQAANSIVPMKKITGASMSSPGTFSVGSALNQMHGTEFLQKNTSLPQISDYHAVLSAKTGNHLTKDLSAFRLDLESLRKNAKSTDSQVLLLLSNTSFPEDLDHVKVTHLTQKLLSNDVKPRAVQAVGKTAESNFGFAAPLSDETSDFDAAPASTSKWGVRPMANRDGTPARKEVPAPISPAAISPTGRQTSNASASRPYTSYDRDGNILSHEQQQQQKASKSIESPSIQKGIGGLKITAAGWGQASSSDFRGSVPQRGLTLSSVPGENFNSMASPIKHVGGLNAVSSSTDSAIKSIGGLKGVSSSLDGPMTPPSSPMKHSNSTGKSRFSDSPNISVSRKDASPSKSPSIVQKLFNTLRRTKIKQKEIMHHETVLHTKSFDDGSEFMNVEKGEILAIIKELPDNTVVVRRESTNEEGLVPRAVFLPKDDYDGIIGKSNSSFSMY